MDQLQEHLDNCLGEENYKIKEHKDKKEKIHYVRDGCEKLFTSQKPITKPKHTTSSLP